MVRRLGGRQWQSLHRSIYAIAIMAVVFLWWMTEKDPVWPIVTLILALLLGMRAWWRKPGTRAAIGRCLSASTGPGKVIRIIAK